MSGKKTIIALMAGIVICFQLVSCSSKTVRPGNYDAAEVGKINKVTTGVIVSLRPVSIHNKTDANGIDTPSEDNTVVRSRGVEYVIKLSGGSIISLVQTDDSELKVKQHVLVIYGTTTRVVPDDGSDDY